MQLAETFTISRGSEDEADVVQVEIEHDGVSGFGEAAPIERYAESAESALDVARPRRRWVTTRSRSTRSPTASRRASTRRARRSTTRCTTCRESSTGQPVYKLLGLRRAGPPTSWTIWLGDPDDMARRTEKIASRGFKRLKLKLGGRDGLDVERVKAVRGVTSMPLQCDVNEAWTLDEALEYLPQMDLQYCEQPLPAGDPDGPELKQRAPLPIYVDEDCHTLADVAACAERAHGINIKLAKVGRDPRSGSHGARRPRARPRRDARLHGRVGARHRARRAHRLTDGSRRPRRQPAARDDPWPGVGFADGVQLPAERPGLGVEPA